MSALAVRAVPAEKNGESDEGTLKVAVDEVRLHVDSGDNYDR